MSSVRFFEIGLGCIVGAALNFMFGYWINVVLLLIGVMFVAFSFLEKIMPAK